MSRNFISEQEEHLNEMARGLSKNKPGYDSTSASLSKISQQKMKNLSAARLEKIVSQGAGVRSRKQKHFESNPHMQNLFEL
jgi:hypothetical protein